MIPDQNTNCIYFSDLFGKRYGRLAGELGRLLADVGVTVRLIPDTMDIWCRDYMPIQVAKNRFVQFRYEPSYLKDDPHLITPPEVTLRALPPEANCTRSEIKVDGGNVVRWTDKAIMTDKMFKENPGSDRKSLTRQLQDLLEVEELIVIPKEPYETFGHSDGMVRFTDANTVLVGNYSQDSKFNEKLLGCLHEHGLATVAMPYNPQKNRQGGQSAIGCYINFLQTQGIVLAPQFGLPEDDRALKTLQDTFPDASVIPLACRDVAEEGGVLNCISWNIST